MSTKQNLIPIETIEHKILFLRNQKVMIDAGIAELYAVTTKALNQAVKRNKDRFPNDFMFRLNKNERKEAVTNCDHLKRLKYSVSLPYVFTEHGAVMLAAVLSSERAVKVSIEIVRAFIKLGEFLNMQSALAYKSNDLEKKYEAQFNIVFKAIRRLMIPPQKPKRPMGFRIEEKRARYHIKRKIS